MAMAVAVAVPAATEGSIVFGERETAANSQAVVGGLCDRGTKFPIQCVLGQMARDVRASFHWGQEQFQARAAAGLEVCLTVRTRQPGMACWRTKKQRR